MDERVAKAGRAARILEDQAFDEAYQGVYSKYFLQFANSKPDEAAVREDAYKRLQALHAIKRELVAMMDNGKLAEHEIARAKALRAA